MTIDRLFQPLPEYPVAFRKQLGKFKNAATNIQQKNIQESVEKQIHALSKIAHEKRDLHQACKKYHVFSKNYENSISKKVDKCVYLLRQKEKELKKLENQIAKQKLGTFNPIIIRDFDKLSLKILQIREETNYHFDYGSATHQLKKAGFWKKLFGICYVDFIQEDSQKWIDAKTKIFYSQIRSFHQDALKAEEWIDICKHIEENKHHWFKKIHSEQLTHLRMKRGSAEGTHRTIRIDGDGKIYLIFKICLGNGNFKKARLSLDYTANVFQVNAVTKIEKETRKGIENEINITKQMRGKKNIVQFHRAIEYTADTLAKGKAPLKKVSMMMDFYNCGDLSNLIKAQVILNPIQKQQLVMDILKGMQRTHKAKIVHRDLKIENIFVNKEIQKDGTVLYRGFVGDYGLACYSNDRIKLKKAVGTRYAFAPEVWQLKDPLIKNKKAVGVASDYYSLGILLAELFGMDVCHVDQFRTLKFSQKPQADDPYYLVWMLTQRDPKARIDIKKALSLVNKIDWSKETKPFFEFVPVN